MASKPDRFLGWGSSASPGNILAPTNALAASGYAPNEVPTSQNFNYELYILDQWNQYLAGQSAVVNAAVSLFGNLRLQGGGQWQWSTGSGVLSWSDTISLAIPSIPDSFNQCAAGNVTLADGAVVYVTVNVPFTTNGDVASGSNQLTVLADNTGVVVGQEIRGDNIPDGTTVVSASGSTVTMSATATGTATAEQVTFISDDALVMTAQDSTTLESSANTLVVGRRFGAYVIIGTNSGQMILRDGESKQLLEQGFGEVLDVTAGVNIGAGNPLYISDGTDGRTTGNAYPCDASIANGATRSNMVGFAMADAASGSDVRIVCSGTVAFGPYDPGATYYLHTTAVGAITDGIPTVAGQYIARAGVAVDANNLLIQKSASQAVQSSAPWPQYGVSNETQLVDAINKCNANNGGVIVLLAGFNISTFPFVSGYTKLLGRGWTTPLWVAGAGNSGLGVGGQALIENVCVINQDSLAAQLAIIYGNNSELVNCQFAVPKTSSITSLLVVGNQNKIVRGRFYGVLNSPTAIGIQFNGQENTDDGSEYTISNLPFTP